MRRRTYLGGVVAAGAAAIAGCSAVSNPSGGSGSSGTDAPFTLKAMRTDANATDVSCTLNESFVSQHDVLREMLADADDGTKGEWVERPANRSTALGVHEALEGYCGSANYGGVYHYNDKHYFVSVETTNRSVKPIAGGGDGANASGGSGANGSA